MEDENGLELSLGLSCGSSSVKPNSKNGSSLDTRAEEIGRSGKIVDELKSIFDVGPQKLDSVTGIRRADSSIHKENLLDDLSKAKEENVPLSLNGRGFWVANNKKPVEIEEDKWLEPRNKRKTSFDEVNHTKKRQSEVHHADLHDTARTLHISMAEDVCGVADSSVIDGDKMFTHSSEKNCKNANLTNRTSFSIQQVNMMNPTYPSPMRESNSICAPSPHETGVMHVMPVVPAATGDQRSNGSLPVMYGYPSGHLPMVDKDNSWDLVSRPQQLHPSFAVKGPPNTGSMRVISSSISEAIPYEGRPLERSKGDAKQCVTEEGSYLQSDNVKGSSSNLRAKDVSDQSKGEGSSADFSVIKPGLAADLKFGGGGPCPNLPWVSTTGSGSNGKTISGVTYRHSINQIRIVCACHGSHMTPEEFVRHANEDQPSPQGTAVLGTAPNGNPAASPHG